jgi:glycosyltransferase involved in cell wall biosynthesis
VGDNPSVPGKPLEVVFAAERVAPPLGGAERAALEVANEVADAGHRVRTIGLERPEATGSWTVSPELGWRALSQPDHEHAFWDWRARVARAEAVAEGLRLALDERPADVVITYDTAVPAVTRVAGERGVPVLICLHGYEPLCHWRFVVGSTCVPESRCRACPRTLALAPAERAARIAHADGHAAAIRDAATLIAASAAIAKAAHDTCGRDPEVIVPITAAPSPAAADPDGPVLAVSSLWTRDKGADLLAPIAQRVRSGRRLVVQVGDGGHHVPLPPVLATLPNVEVRTEPAEIGDLLPGAAALIVPSQMPDPWPRVAFEGMAAGVPVLASDTGGLRESVPAPQRIKQFDDPDAWAEALRRLDDRAVWEAARERGRAAAAKILATRPAERFVAAVEATAQATANSGAAARPQTASSAAPS